MHNWWLAFQGFAAEAKEPVAVIGTVMAVVIGLSGLATWRRQLHGSSKYAVARSVLLEAYRVQEAIAAVRDPFIAYDRKEAEEKGKLFVIGQVYEERMRLLIDHWVKLRALELEATVLWGDSGKKALDDLEACVRKLRGDIGLHLATHYDRNAVRPQDAEDRLLADAATKTVWGVKDDAFSAKVAAAMKCVEAVYRPRLK